MKLFSVVTLLLVVASYSADHVNAQPHLHIFQNVYNWFSGNKALSRAKSGSVLEHSNDGAHENVGVKANNNNNNNTWISKMQHGLEALAKELEQKIIDSDGSSLTQLPNTSTPMPEDDRPDEEEVEEIDDDEELEKCEMLNGTIGYCQPTKHCVMQEPEQRKFTVCKWSNGQEEKLTRSPPEKLCCPKVTVSMQQLKHNFEQWLEQSKKEMFAAGLPKKPDGHCGMSSVESQAQLDLRSFSRSEKLVRYPNKPRIVLGKNVQLGQIPWMVAIYYREQFLCGGSIISERHVVTAAHCLSSNRLPQDYTVRYESVLMFNGTRNQVQSFIIHEDYSPPAIYHDIALVTLAQPIKFNSFVQPVCLPGKRMYNELMVGQMGYVSGFGDLSFGGAQATLLQEVDIKVINNTFCDVNYRKLSESGRKFRHGIGKSLICAGYKNGGKDACQGDSGGPMTMNYRGANYLVGIVSFGYRCALPRFPGVYTCVAHYLNWIFDNLQV